MSKSQARLGGSRALRRGSVWLEASRLSTSSGYGQCNAMNNGDRLDNRVKPVADAQSPLLRAIHAYWLDKCGDRTMPARNDLDPVDIPALLPNLVLVDVLPPDGRLRARLVGTWIVNQFGRDDTGRFLDEVDFGEAQEEIVREYSAAAAGALAVCSDHRYRNLGGHIYDIERLILPLSEDGKTVTMLLIALDFTERVSTPPSHL